MDLPSRRDFTSLICRRCFRWWETAGWVIRKIFVRSHTHNSETNRALMIFNRVGSAKHWKISAIYAKDKSSVISENTFSILSKCTMEHSCSVIYVLQLYYHICICLYISQKNDFSSWKIKKDQKKKLTGSGDDKVE